MRSYLAHRARLAGFTMPEVMVVVGIIALLIAVLLPALSSANRTAAMAKSMSNLKQIAQWMTMYSSDNREYIVPSQFDYSMSAAPPPAGSGYPVKVRSDAALVGSPMGNLQYKGTWTDILWTYNKLGAGVGAEGSMPLIYAYDSPDKAVFDDFPEFDEDVFRAAVVNQNDFPIGGPVGTGPKPFGTGATETAYPGFFAANNFFNADPAAPIYYPGIPAAGTLGRWFTNSQIKAPDRSMYLVDSYAGETIDPVDGPFNNDPPPNTPRTGEVDFRYTGVCLMMFLDGHSEPQQPWLDLNDLQQQRRIKVQALDRN